MFTRLKALTMFLIFCVSLVLSTIILGPDGILARRALQEEKARMEKILLEKEAELENLRNRNIEGNATTIYGKDLVYDFGVKEIYEPEKESVKDAPRPVFQGFDTFRLVLASLVPTGIYLIIVILRFLKEDQNQEEIHPEEKVRLNDRYND